MGQDAEVDGGDGRPGHRAGDHGRERQAPDDHGQDGTPAQRYGHMGHPAGRQEGYGRRVRRQKEVPGGPGGGQRVAAREEGVDRRRDPREHPGHGPGDQSVGKNFTRRRRRPFEFCPGWVAIARFAQFLTVRARTTGISNEGTTLHVFLLLRLPASPLAASVARHAVLGLAPFLDPGVAENAELLVSELVTNSVRHAGLPEEASIEFTVRASPDVLMVEVADCGHGFDHTSPARPRAVAGVPEPSGWGLFLVDRIADRWGAVQMDGETRVWFELTPGANAPGAHDDGTAIAG